MTYKCFVMMPFSGDFSNDLLNRIRESLSFIPDVDIAVTRADFGKPLDLRCLERHITKHISQCDFAVAEVSNFNPNVLLEAGYILGINKPLIIMIKKGKKVPSDIQGRYWYVYDPKKLELVPQNLSDFMRSAINEIKANFQSNSFRLSGFRDRRIAPIIERVKKAEKFVLCLTTNLNWHLESGLIEVLKNRLTSSESLQAYVLTLDPEVAYTSDRAEQLDLDAYKFRTDLRNALVATESKLKDFYSRCKIAIYKTFPTQISFIVDGFVYSGVVSAKSRARYNPVFEVSLYQAGIKDAFYDHFRSVWSMSKLIDGQEPGPLPEYFD